MDLSLRDLMREVSATGATLHGAETTFVSGIQQDSRAVQAGDLFVARRGQASDGTRFVAAAVAAGAQALLAERGSVDPAAIPVPTILVDDVARALGFFASAIYRHPSFSLEIAGVTGTNGKTTTTHLVRSLLDGLAGRPSCATLGTVGVGLGTYAAAPSHTTPEGDALARTFDDLRVRGADAVAMEVSSIAIELGRVNGVRFRVASFGNLTQDHLDFHGTMEAYGAAKAKLFTELGPGAAVVNTSDSFGATLFAGLHVPKLAVSPDGEIPGVRPPDLFVRAAKRVGIHTEVVLATPDGDLRSVVPFVGRHNLENLVVALGIVRLFDHDLRLTEALLPTLIGAPGRLEPVSQIGEVPVFVDYAHTPDALVRVLEALRPAVAPGGRLICIFGCGGDRDATKRGPMGLAVGRGADVALVTNDNPRTEEPEAIARPILAALETLGVPTISRADLKNTRRGTLALLDRAAAIEAAIEAAQRGDVVLIAGKGHEDYQILGTTKHPFDDRIVARRALDALR